jgi:hypothetical protein
MKKRIFLIMAGIVAASVGAYRVCRRLGKTMSKECNKKSTSNDSVHNTQDVSTSEETYTSTAADVCETREVVVHSVRERHSEAAKAMEQSLNTVFNDSINDDIVTENSQTLGKTSGDLDDLLK